MGSCQKRPPITRSPIYYIQTLESKNANNSEDQNMKQKVKLTLSLKQIKDSREKKIILLLNDSNDKVKQSKEYGSTESATKNNNDCINFSQFFVMEYYFEKEQFIEFQINNGIKTIIIETTLGNIMGSRGQKYINNLEDNTVFEVSGQELSNNNMKAKIEVSLNGNLPQKGISYLVKYLGKQNSPQNNNIYRSEIINNSLNNVKFSVPTFPSMFLCPDGNYDQNIISIELWDFISSIKLNENIGPLSKFINNPFSLTFPNGTANIKLTLEKEYSFLDYLRGGVQINLTIGIDYTASNGKITSPTSLHYIGTNQLNSYEIAIKSCGNIVAYYDYDQLFPVYGYGAKLNNSTIVNHCFAINMDNNNPEINSIDNVLYYYRQSLSQVDLYGPTYFSPIMNEMNRKAREYIESGKNDIYHILMILTDGIINDMESTVDAVVEASYLPISIIIIGIGDSNFRNMHILDSDNEILYDSNKRAADRDCVQFVEFNKFNNDGIKLAQEVLAEIPKQLIEYFQHKKIPPGDPIIDLA